MQPLAQLYRSTGVRVTGCDSRVAERQGTAEAAELATYGVCVTGHDPAHLGANVDIVVHSVAVAADHAELTGARRRGIPVLTRAAALAKLLPRIADRTVAVSGVTGKSTTTALVAQLYRLLGHDPTLYLGCALPDDTPRGPGDRAIGDIMGRDRIAVLEACEYQRGMLRYDTDVATVTTSFWGEHTSTYPDAASLRDAFTRFLSAAPRAVVPDGEADLLAPPPRDRDQDRIITFGTSQRADLRLAELRHTEQGFHARYTYHGQAIETQTLFPGRHNALNLAAALASHLAAGTPLTALQALTTYDRLRMPCRRLQLVGRVRGTDLYDDYAHNPVQFVAALNVLRQRYTGPIGAYYLPGGFGRLHALGDGYLSALAQFDRVVLAPSRRGFEDSASTPDESAFSERTVRRLRALGTPADIVPMDQLSLDIFDGCAAAGFFGAIRMNGILPGLLATRDHIVEADRKAVPR